MSTLITGVAGFVGSNLAAALLRGGEQVIGFDNLSRGSLRNVEALRDDPRFRIEVVDLADIDAYRAALAAHHSRTPILQIWHMAANSDIPGGIADPRIDLRDTFMTTFNTLVLMRELRILTLFFASSSAVYGDLGERRLEENVGPLLPISNYGAMKLASEGAISAALESHLQRAFIYRFPNVIGVPATHGVILDFVRKLRATPRQLDVLGDGTQQKSYLHVDDLVDAMLFIRRESTDRLAYYNIGARDRGVTVRFIAESVVERVAPGARIAFGSGNRGWVGDVPRFVYSVDKLSSLGWTPKLDSERAIRKAIDEVAYQESSL